MGLIKQEGYKEGRGGGGRRKSKRKEGRKEGQEEGEKEKGKGLSWAEKPRERRKITRLPHERSTDTLTFAVRISLVSLYFGNEFVLVIERAPA